MNGLGRPKKVNDGAMLGIYVERATLEKIENAAHGARESKAAFVRAIIEKHFADSEQKQ